MKTTMPLWIGLMMLMFLLVLGASFQFLYMELNEERNAIVEIEETIAAQSEEEALVEGTIVALGDQLTQQAVPLADYAATGTAESLPAGEPTITGTVETVEVDAAVTPVVSDVTPTLISETVEVTLTATPELPTADFSTSSITIISPKEGDVISVNDEFFLDVVILDEAGVLQAWLAVDGIEVNRFSINDFPEFNYTPRWVPEDVGERELTVGAINSAGFAIRPQSVVVTVGNTASDDG